MILIWRTAIALLPASTPMDHIAVIAMRVMNSPISIARYASVNFEEVVSIDIKYLVHRY